MIRMARGDTGARVGLTSDTSLRIIERTRHTAEPTTRSRERIRSRVMLGTNKTFLPTIGPGDLNHREHQVYGTTRTPYLTMVAASRPPPRRGYCPTGSSWASSWLQRA